MMIWIRTYDQQGNLKGYLNLDNMDEMRVEQVGRKYRLMVRGGYTPISDGSWAWRTLEYIWSEGFETKQEAMTMLERYVMNLQLKGEGLE